MERVERVNKIKGTVDPVDHGKLIDLVDNLLTTYKLGDDYLLRSNIGDEFLDYVLMSDQYFFDHWITQFAINEVGGKNYFNIQGWSDITDRFTKGVIVVHEETKQFLLHIPKFIKVQTSAETSHVINHVCKIANNIKFQTDPAMQQQSVNAFASVVTDVLDNDAPAPTITDLIPNEIYALCGIVPKALKAVIYIRDHYKTITPDDPNFDKVTEILKNHFSGRLVSEKDKQLIRDLTYNDFYFDESELEVGDAEPSPDENNKQTTIKENVFSPFSD